MIHSEIFKDIHIIPSPKIGHAMKLNRNAFALGLMLRIKNMTQKIHD